MCCGLLWSMVLLAKRRFGDFALLRHFIGRCYVSRTKLHSELNLFRVARSMAIILLCRRSWVLSIRRPTSIRMEIRSLFSQPLSSKTVLYLVFELVVHDLVHCIALFCSWRISSASCNRKPLLHFCWSSDLSLLVLWLTRFWPECSHCKCTPQVWPRSGRVEELLRVHWDRSMYMYSGNHQVLWWTET